MGMPSPVFTAKPDVFARFVTALPEARHAVAQAMLLVDPTGFAVSAESATDNAYMDTSRQVDPARARAQFDGLLAALSGCGVPCLVFPGQEGLDDGVFPNNVFGTSPGRLVVGSMRHEVRRAEARRTDIRQLFTGPFGYALHDLSEQDCVAELTGVLAIDRARGVGVCGMTQRVDQAGARAMCAAFDLRAMLVTPLVPSEYHINIVLALLAGRAAVVHLPSFEDAGVGAMLDQLYPGAVLRLSDAEKATFAGNCIAVTTSVVMMSATAWQGLAASSRAWFSQQGFTVVPVAVDEFEKGGGSLRCLLAEVF